MTRQIQVIDDLAYIPLNDGVCAIIDADDLPKVASFTWHVSKECATSYARSHIRLPNGNRKKIRMHRLLMDNPYGVEVDHVNSNGLDNRKSNLRLATHEQNMRNASMRKDNSSGVKGVSWSEATKRWIAAIRVGGPKKYLGSFKELSDAAQAYAEASKKFHGEFGRVALNGDIK